MVGNLTKESLNIINNRFINMVEAGSKGNIINICQMIACVGLMRLMVVESETL